VQYSWRDCSSSDVATKEVPQRDERRTPKAQTQSSGAPIPQAKPDKPAAFLDRARPVEGVVDPPYELEQVSYTSPTDVVAQINDSRPYAKGAATVIVTTDDNWTHAAGLSMSNGLADSVEFPRWEAGPSPSRPWTKFGDAPTRRSCCTPTDTWRPYA